MTMESIETTPDLRDRPAVRVELRRVPGCPLADQVPDVLSRAVAATGVAISFVEREGTFASPTVLVGGSDVTGRSVHDAPACRLDIPTQEQVGVALLARAEPSRPR